MRVSNSCLLNVICVLIAVTRFYFSVPTTAHSYQKFILARRAEMLPVHHVISHFTPKHLFYSTSFTFWPIVFLWKITYSYHPSISEWSPTDTHGVVASSSAPQSISGVFLARFSLMNVCERLIVSCSAHRAGCAVLIRTVGAQKDLHWLRYL